jgi:hypothetical protein
MFQGEPGKFGRGAIGASESGHGNDCKDDKRDHAPDWALWLGYGVFGV